MYQTIHEAAAAIKEGKVTPIELVEQCLAAIDEWEPKVKAWVFVDRDYARSEAERLTEDLKKGRYRGPLHGIPIGVKDIFDVFDWPTAAGSKLWANSIARQDAPIIRNLRAAGCIFLGKTVTTLFASFDPPVTRNPWNLERTPGGSSSGSAATVATLMCLGALGSQTGGSITRPASYCGVCGLKPTYGVMPLDGIVPLAPPMDHPGPIGRCVEDLAMLADGMMGRETEWTSAARSPSAPRQLGRLHGFFDDRADAAVRKMMDEACERLRGMDVKVADYELPSPFADILQRHRSVMAVGTAKFHGVRLKRHPDDYLPKIRCLIEEGLACPDAYYEECLLQQPRSAYQREYPWSAKEILLTPATTSAAPGKETTGDPVFNSPWSYTGLPTVSLPTGHFDQGLPLAIQLVGASRDEATLFSTAAWVEKTLNVKPLTPPRLS